MSGYLAINLDEASIHRLLMEHAEQNSISQRTILLRDFEDRDMSFISTFPEEHALFAASIDKMDDSIGVDAEISYAVFGGEQTAVLQTNNRRGQWRLIELIPMQEMYRGIEHVRAVLLGLGAVALLMAFPIASYLSRKITAPIPNLIRGFQRLEGGNFPEPLEGHFIIEFNKLYHSFNQMTEQLRDVIDQLEAEHLQKRDLELKVLQSQINPHFLYNTLDMINWMAAMKGNEEVSIMAFRLAKLFRISVSNGNTLITLRDELEHARAYTDIQKSRYEMDFTYREEVAGQFKHYYVPKIILQPLIENCFIHGFEEGAKEKAEIIISCRDVDGEKYEIWVEDNGVGLTESSASAVNRKARPYAVPGTGGYGSKNVEERIQLYLGKEYGIRMENRVMGGLRAIIVLPYLQSPEDAAHYRQSGRE